MRKLKFDVSGEELEDLTYESLQQLSEKYPDAYFSHTLVASLVGKKITGKSYEYFQPLTKISSILEEFVDKGKVGKVKVVRGSDTERPQEAFCYRMLI